MLEWAMSGGWQWAALVLGCAVAPTAACCATVLVLRGEVVEAYAQAAMCREERDRLEAQLRREERT